MPRFEHLPTDVAAWITAGNDPPDAGDVKAELTSAGVTADVSVMSNGTIVVDTSATESAVHTVLDAHTPSNQHGTDLSALSAQITLIRAVAVASRTPVEKAILLLAVLGGYEASVEG